MRLGGPGGIRYELLSPLGSGMFGTVWRAFDHDEQSELALKLLNPTTTPDRVLREAQLQRRLSAHPRIVSMRNVEVGANPSSFVALELIQGGSVADALHGGRPTVLETHRWIRDVLEALDHAHEENVLHRDIKPSNLLLGDDGHAMLTDFGVAEDSFHRAVPDPGMYQLTLPPEFGTGPTTVQTDLWLVGVLAWQLLVGVRPDLAMSYAGKLLLPHRYSYEVPIALSRAVMPALNPDPASRPESAQRMLESISRVPVHCGWTDVATGDPAVVRRWQADGAGDGVVIEIRKRPRGGFLVEAHAMPGCRLRVKRRAAESTEAAALQRARSWLTAAVGGATL
jgi:eukaryotic-like serine/threonine-protein kinase